MLPEDREKKMCTMSGMRENIKSSDGRMSGDTQRIHPSGRRARKTKRKGEGIVKRPGKEEEEKTSGV